MTWGEFKRAVEAQGLKDSDEVAYIDWQEWKHNDPIVEDYRVELAHPDAKSISDE